MKNYGFTLIELLVTITILMIIVGGSIAGFINFRDRRDVQESAKQVQQLFILAQQKASVREVPSNCLANNFPLRAYRVSISNTTPRTATLTAICVSNAVTARPFPQNSSSPPVNGQGTYQNIQTITLPNAVSITPANTYLEFYTLEGGVSATRTYNFTGATTYSFEVQEGGTISNVTQ